MFTFNLLLLILCVVKQKLSSCGTQQKMLHGYNGEASIVIVVHVRP